MKKLIILIVVILSVISCTSKSGENLIEAVKANDFEKVKRIADTKNVNTTDETGATPVMWAAYNGNVEMLDFLVKKGADVRKKGIIGINTNDIPKTYTNAIIAAAGEGHLETVKYLVEKVGISPDEKGLCLNIWNVLPEEVKNTDGLIEFIEKSEGEIFELIKSSEHYALLKKVASTDKSIVLSLILGNIIFKKDLNNKKFDSYALRRVVNNRKKIDNIFDNFLTKKTSYEYVKDQNGPTALVESSFQGRKKVTVYLIEKGADVNAKDCYGFPPLIAAAIKKNFEIMRILLENKADKNVKVLYSNEKASVLSQFITTYCIEKSDDFRKNIGELLPFLWKNEKDIIESSTDVYPHPLLEPCLCKDSELVKIMMENGADYSKIEYKGRTLKDICKENGIEIKDEWLKKKDK